MKCEGMSTCVPECSLKLHCCQWITSLRNSIFSRTGAKSGPKICGELSPMTCERSTTSCIMSCPSSGSGLLATTAARGRQPATQLEQVTPAHRRRPLFFQTLPDNFHNLWCTHGNLLLSYRSCHTTGMYSVAGCRLVGNSLPGIGVSPPATRPGSRSAPRRLSPAVPTARRRRGRHPARPALPRPRDSRGTPGRPAAAASPWCRARPR